MLIRVFTPEVELFLILGALLILGKVLVSIAARWRIAPVFVLVAIGIIAGPGLVGIVPWGGGAEADANGERLVVEILEYVGKIGVLIILFMAGLETDLPTMRRSGAVGAASAVGGVVLPFGAGFLVASAFGFHWLQAALVGTILTATSVSVTVMTLWDLGRLRSTVGQGILSAAVIDDILGILCLTVVLGYTRDGTALWAVMLKTLGFLAVALMFGWLTFPFLLSQARRLKAPQSMLAVSFGILFLYAGGAEFCRIEPIVGAYLAGFCLSQTAFARSISERVEVVGQSIFIPLFFITVGLRATFEGLGGHLGFILLFLAAGMLAKALGSGGAARLMGLGAKDSLRLGVGMVPRGEVALVVAAAGARALVPGTGERLLAPEVFNGTILLVVVTALVTPQVLRMLYRGEAAEPTGDAPPSGPASGGAAGAPAKRPSTGADSPG